MLSQNERKRIIALINREVVPAIGCTEPIAIAYAAAKAVYDVMPVKLSGVEDMQRKYFASPTECLFALSNNALIDYSVAVLGNPGERVGSGLYITQKMYNELYEGVSGEAHIRDLSWNKNTLDNFGSKQCVVKKYYYNTSESHEADVLLMKLQIVPIRFAVHAVIVSI